MICPATGCTVSQYAGPGTSCAVKVAAINVNGASNKITIGEVGTINVNGAKNAITWKKASTGTKPGVAVVGPGNKISNAR